MRHSFRRWTVRLLVENDCTISKLKYRYIDRLQKMQAVLLYLAYRMFLW